MTDALCSSRSFLLLNILDVQSSFIDLICNVRKIVCMIFMSKNRNPLFTTVFAPFKIGSSVLQFDPQFKYLGHILINYVYDDSGSASSIFNSQVSQFFKTSLIEVISVFLFMFL